MPLDRATLLIDVPRRLMAQNRDWADDFDTILENANHFLLERIHPDFLKAGVELTLPANQRTLDLTLLALSEVRTITCRGPYGTAPVLARSLDFCRALYPDDRERDLPAYYAETEMRGRFDLFPFPPRGYSYLVAYNLRAAPITTAAPTNAFTIQEPHLFRLACYREGALWMGDPRRVGEYDKLVEAELVAINSRLARRRRDEAQPAPRTTTNVQGA